MKIKKLQQSLKLCSAEHRRAETKLAAAEASTTSLSEAYREAKTRLKDARKAAKLAKRAAKIMAKKRRDARRALKRSHREMVKLEKKLSRLQKKPADKDPAKETNSGGSKLPSKKSKSEEVSK